MILLQNVISGNGCIKSALGECARRFRFWRSAMTDRELKKLSRVELLEMLLLQTREVERLQAELEQARDQLNSRELEMSQAGNIAEAALQVSGIFEAAQKAAEQYLENVRTLEDGTLERCNRMEELCRERCRKHVQQAEQEAKQFWLQIQEDIRNPYTEHERWIRIHSALTGKVYEKIEF